MPLDVNDLTGFYASALGEVARRFIERALRARWTRCSGLSMMGLGYAGPFLDRYREEAARTLVFMPAQQGVVNWPSAGRSSSALIDPAMLPLPDASIDRILVIHALETAEDPNALLEEAWRILDPGGRAIFVIPSRRGVWARIDGTPFGFGRPYSKAQLRELLRETLFTPVFWGEALYMPPLRRRIFLNWSNAIEGLGSVVGFPFAGVHIVEATKQLYRPVGIRRVARRSALVLRPALAPTANRSGLALGARCGSCSFARQSRGSDALNVDR